MSGLSASKTLLAVRDYKAKFNLDAVLAAAVDGAARANASNPYEAIAAQLREMKLPEAAAGGVDSDATNDAMHALGILKHDPPDFQYLDPVVEDSAEINHFSRRPGCIIYHE